jgi:HAD superfamily hydrolase (TIGR01509 family)
MAAEAKPERQAVATGVAVASASWPRAAVFDCDGLLVDSGACWEQAYHAVAASFGRALDDVDLDALAGASVATAASQLSAALQITVDEKALRVALLESVAATTPPVLPGARELVAALTRRMPLAVATNAPRDVVLDVLERAGLRGAFAAVVSAEETPAHKPAPHVYIEACLRLGVATCDAIAFEDSAPGAQAARTAGLFVVAVPSVPGVRVAGDLVVPRLSDPRLLAYLGLVGVSAPFCTR